MPPKRRRAPKKVCEGCGQLGAKEVLLDDRGLQAGVFLFCDACWPKLKYRTGDYVLRWYRISPSLPPTRHPHRDVDLWTLPRWGEDASLSGRLSSSESEDKKGVEFKQSSAVKDDTKGIARKTATSTDFFATLKAAKDADPMPAHIKPLKRFALMVLADVTLSGSDLGSFNRLRNGLHECLRQPLIDQMFETNRLRDHFRKKALDEEKAASEASKGLTVKRIESYAATHKVEEQHDARHEEFDSSKNDADDEVLDLVERAKFVTRSKDNWKQFSKHFINQLPTFVWKGEPQMIDLASSGLGPRDLDLLCDTVARQTVGKLSLKWNLLGSKNSGFLHTILSTDNIHTIDIGWNKLYDDGAQVIAAALPQCSMLRDLDLTGNGITKSGIAHICMGMGEAPQIQRLNLSFNPLGAEGAITLVESGLGNAPLTHLGLRSCELGINGAISIARGFRKNTTLKEMMLADNQVTREGARQIARNLKLSPGALLRAFGCSNDNRRGHQLSSTS